MLTPLEKQKIRIEIERLKYPWWRRPDYLGVLVPTTLAIASLAVVFFTGYFDVESRRLQLERLILQKEIYEFKGQRDSLMHDVQVVKSKLEENLRTLASLTREKKLLEMNISNLKSEISKKEQELERARFAMEFTNTAALHQNKTIYQLNRELKALRDSIESSDPRKTKPR